MGKAAPILKKKTGVMDLVQEAYKKLFSGMKRVDLVIEGVTVKAYWCGAFVRIDIIHKGFVPPS